MNARRGLGKGLDAILPADIVEEVFGDATYSERFCEVSIDDIEPNPMQPREGFDEDALKDLAESIRRQGILQPVIVMPRDGGYVLVAGERRWRAARMAGLSKIPALVLSEKLSGEQLLFMALVENLQREDLDPVEEAEAYRTLSKKFGLKQDEIARRVGKSRPAISNALRILRLPEPVLELLRAGKISAGHARVLLEEEDSARQIRLAQLAARRGLSVERLAVLVSGKQEKRKQVRRKKSPKIAAMEEEIALALGTKVEIIPGRKKSKLVIEFYSQDELFDIIDKILERSE